MSSCPPLVTVSPAASNRSSCRRCKDKIEKGEYRIGVEAWVAGRQSMTWQHPLCFVESLEVDLVDKGVTGKCKATKVKIERGELRTSVYSGNAKFYLSLNGCSVLAEALARAVPNRNDMENWIIKHVSGIRDITPSQRSEWLAAAADSRDVIQSSPEVS